MSVLEWRILNHTLIMFMNFVLISCMYDITCIFEFNISIIVLDVLELWLLQGILETVINIVCIMTLFSTTLHLYLFTFKWCYLSIHLLSENLHFFLGNLWEWLSFNWQLMITDKLLGIISLHYFRYMKLIYLNIHKPL